MIGAGGVGLNAIQGARGGGGGLLGLVVSSLWIESRQKLEIAQEFGATDVVLTTDPEPWQLARQAWVVERMPSSSPWEQPLLMKLRHSIWHQLANW